MDPAFSEAVPFALGILLSPFPVVPVILLLLSDRATATGTAFLATFVAGVALVTTVFVLLSELIDFPEHPPNWASWTRIGLGTALIVLAVRQWLTRDPDGKQPAWLASVESASPGRAAQLGLLLSVANPKVLVLAAGGGLVLGAGDTTGVGTAALILLFAALSAAAVAVPVLLHVVLGDRIRPVLVAARDWLQRNNSTITTIVIGAVGLLVAGNGVSAL